MVAEDHNLMEPWGIDLNLVTLDGQSKVVPSLLSGEVQFASSTPEQAMTATLQNPSLQMVVSSFTANPYVVVAKGGVDDLDDLSGKTIGVNALGASADYFSAKIALEDHGLEEGDDYTFVQSGNTAQRVSALESGQIDAMLAWEPDVSRAEEVGAAPVMSLAEVSSLKGAQFSTFVALESWYDENSDVAERWVRGYQETIRWLQDPENREDVVRSIAAHLDVSDEQAERTYKQFLVDLPAEDPVSTFNVESLEKMLENAQAAGVDALGDVDGDDLDGFFDNTLVDNAKELHK
ncbi:ABC transporter substrate-binding protein [Nocardioidaceae bacterium SCSIO 66511]|nr:ABC transporter substrate-binding protein [Nocardioidaceae bacterium SCSIO 66511]